MLMQDNIETGRCIDGSPHNFVRSDGKQMEDMNGYGGYVRKDVFFCSKCLLMHAIVRRHHNKLQDGPPPDWYTQ